MVLECLCILPHGALLLDSRQHLTCAPEACDRLAGEVCEFVASMEACCDNIFAPPLSADTIVVLTPHGHQCEDRFLIYRNARAYGSAAWDGCWSTYTISCTIDTSCVDALCEHFASSSLSGHDGGGGGGGDDDHDDDARHVPILKPFIAFSETAEAPLGWGEVVPLYFIAKAWERRRLSLSLPHLQSTPTCPAPTSASGPTEEKTDTNSSDHAPILSKVASSLSLPPVIIISLPLQRRRFDENFPFILRNFATTLTSFLEAEKQSFALVISADLAHTHPAPLTHPHPPYPPLLNGIPEQFDQMIERLLFSLRGYKVPSEEMDHTAPSVPTTLSNPTNSQHSHSPRSSSSLSLPTTSSATLIKDLIALFREHQVGCCGLSGVIILHEIMHALPHFHFLREHYARFHPTYYGMLTAVFKRLRDTSGLL